MEYIHNNQQYIEEANLARNKYRCMTWYHEERENRFSAIETRDSWGVAFACHLLEPHCAIDASDFGDMYCYYKNSLFFIFQNEENK